MSRHVEIEIINRHCAYIRGRGAREALMTVTGGDRAPVWGSLARAWVCSERTARERLLPHLEHLGYSVEIIGPRTAAVKPEASNAAEVIEDSLW